MSVLNFLLKNLQGCCLLFNYQGSFSLLSSQQQLIHIIIIIIACQQLFYFSFLLFFPVISVVRNSLSRISFQSAFVNRKFLLFSFFFRFFLMPFSNRLSKNDCFTSLPYARLSVLSSLVSRDSLSNISCRIRIVNIVFIIYFICTIPIILVISFCFTCSYFSYSIFSKLSSFLISHKNAVKSPHLLLGTVFFK